MPHPRQDALDLIDPADWTSGADAAGRAREERRRLRRESQSPQGLLSSRSGRVLAGTSALLLLVTLVGLVALWPDDRTRQGGPALGAATRAAEITAAPLTTCPGPGGQRCRSIVARLDEGPDAGRTTRILLGTERTAPSVEAGDAIRLTPIAVPPGAVSTERYAFADVDRRGPLLWLAIAFAVLAVALVRWRGALAVIGVGLSLLLVTRFLLPAILEGSSALLVSLVGALAVMFITVVLTYGIGAPSLAAIVGISASLVLATSLAHVTSRVAELDGSSGELSNVLAQSVPGVSLQGVVVAGMVIGALGVLTDMAVSQASSVMALRRAGPALGALELYRRAFAIGRDHLASTIHTLVLAYVGASLPLLLVLSGGSVGFGDAVNGQDLAEPAVATLVGSIALVVAVPLTTGLAALLAARVPVAALGDGHAGHVH